MGVSGGADSMALCALMAHWKTFPNGGCFDSSGFVDGLLAIIVDHGLRLESKEEAVTVSRWVSDMGINQFCLPLKGYLLDSHELLWFEFGSFLGGLFSYVDSF